MGDLSTKTINNSLKIVVAALFVFLMCSQLFQRGIFTDGLTYGILSNNLANNIGSFWYPSYSKTEMATFTGHPPLVFGIQSLFFRMFGDEFYVEKLYSLFTALVTIFLILLVWKKVVSQSFKKLYWLPIGMWLLVPLCPWAYSNNILENTLGVLSLGAIYVLLCSIGKSLFQRSVYYLISAVFLVLGTFSKGFVGLFPLAFFLCYYLVYRKETKFTTILLNSLLITILFLSCLVLVFCLNGDAKANFASYMVDQIMTSLQGKGPTVNRWFILGILFQELLPLILIVLFSRAAKHRFPIKPSEIKTAFLFLLLGLTASLPIMLSPKQLGFYIIPSLPYFAIGVSVLLAPVVNAGLQKVAPYSNGIRAFRYISIVLLFTGIFLTINNYGTYCRDKEKIEDVVLLGKHLQHSSIVSITKPLYKDLILKGHLQRKFHISCERLPTLRDNVVIPIKDTYLENYIEEKIGLTKFRLMRRVK